MACNQDLRDMGLPYPRTCSDCGFGPCKKYPRPAAPAIETVVSNNPDYEILTIWVVFGNDDRQTHYNHILGFYSTRAKADIGSMGQGWWGGKGTVESRMAIKIDDKVFPLLLAKGDPVQLDVNPRDISAELRKKALEKLTLEEIKLLGLS